MPHHLMPHHLSPLKNNFENFRKSPHATSPFSIEKIILKIQVVRHITFLFWKLIQKKSSHATSPFSIEKCMSHQHPMPYNQPISTVEPQYTYLHQIPWVLIKLGIRPSILHFNPCALSKLDFYQYLFTQMPFSFSLFTKDPRNFYSITI